MGTSPLFFVIYLSRMKPQARQNSSLRLLVLLFYAFNKTMLRFVKLLKRLRRKQLGMKIDDEPTTSLNSISPPIWP